MKQLKEKDLIFSACEEMLQRNFSGVPVALFKRMTSNSGEGCKYSSELKAFAGFTEPSLKALLQKVKKKLVCSLMIDEIAIKKHVSWDGKKFRGYINLGNDVEDDSSAPTAKDALV